MSPISKRYENLSEFTPILLKFMSFVILRASATIKTLLFNLLECRNRYGIEV